MRLVQFRSSGKWCPGVWLGEEYVIDLQEAAYAFPQSMLMPPKDVLSLLQQGDEALREIENIIQRVKHLLQTSPDTIPHNILLPKDGLQLGPPLHNPQKIMAIGLNYLDHCQENDLEPPSYPIMFAKLPSAIVGPEHPIQWPAGLSKQVDFEAEFAVVIGKQARRVPKEQALQYVVGYTILNDISARDLQFADGQWVRAKSIDTFCPMGPCIVTRDEIQNPHGLDIRCLLNGKEMQHSNTRHLIFGVEALVSFLSENFTLQPGDIISTGTPGGIGYYQKPPRFLQPGDEVVVEIEGLGQLRNPVKGPVD